MARKKISEYKAKTLILGELGLPYQGIHVATSDLSPLTKLSDEQTYAVKVDQGIKKRFKLGLVALDIPKAKVMQEIEKLQAKGYTEFIIEPYLKHETSEERYLSVQRSREGLLVFISRQGGIEIESQQGFLKKFVATQNTLDEISRELGIAKELFEKLIQAIDKFHISFLEINPLVIKDNDVFFLDLAVEVDSAGVFFVRGSWTEEDFVGEVSGKTKEERTIDALSSKSQASFRLVVLNPNGSIFMLLSGGGASIVLADEVYNQGKGKELANYGEYSGNPNAEETYLYTKELLSLLLASKAKTKVLIIAGGVANFTDIRITFKGVIQAIEEVESELKKQGVKVYVRRGGPYQEEGLALMKSFLEKSGLLGSVFGPELVLTDIVQEALDEKGK